MTENTDGKQQLSLNPIVDAFLTQLLAYVGAHAGEIIDAMIELIKKHFGADADIPDAVDKAFAQFRFNPSPMNFDLLLNSVKDAGIDKDKIAGTVLNMAHTDDN